MARSRSIASLGVGCAVLLAACQSPPPPVGEQQWIRLETAHFEMWSAAPADTSRVLIEDLERFRSILPRLAQLATEPAIGPKSDGKAEPIRIVAFADPVTFDRFRRAAVGPSIALATLDGTVLALDASAEEARADLRHGLVHASVRRSGVDVPAWYEEGLAAYLAEVEIEAGAVVLGVLPARYAEWLKLGNPLPLRRVLGAGSSRITWSPGELVRFATHSWALVHLLRSDSHLPEEQRDRSLVEAVERSLRTPDAEPAGSDGNSDALQTAFSAYVRQNAFAKFTLTATLPTVAPARVHPVSQGESLEMLAGFATDLGAPDALIALLHQGAVRADPTKIFSALETAARDPEAPATGTAAALEELERREPGSADAWTGIGDVWRALGARDPADPEDAVARAATAYHRAIDLDAAHPGALRGLAATFGDSWEDHVAAAMLLRRAAAEAPGVVGTELRLADRLARAGQTRRAGVILERLAGTPHLGAILDPAALGGALGQSGVSLREREDRLWDSQLALSAPAAGAVLEQMAPWVEVAGSAGLGESARHDVVVALDLSQASNGPSGLDVNGNGRVGRGIETSAVSPLTLPSRGPTRTTVYSNVRTTDPGDSILAAERWVAAELVEQLDPATTRVAVVGYDSNAHLIAPFGTPREAASALDEFRGGTRLPVGASIQVGLLGSLRVLRDGEETGPPRRTTIVLLAGEPPAHPNTRIARRRAVEAADTLAQLGVRVHTFEVGRKAPKQLAILLRKISAATDGEHSPVPDVTTVRMPDPGPRLSGLESVEIRNATTGVPARARRVFADGSFDALVPLVPGENQIEVVARFADRAPRRELRQIQYTIPDEPTELQRRRAAVMLWELRNRSIEVATRLDIADAQAAQATRLAGTARIPEAPPLPRTELSLEVAQDEAAEPDPEEGSVPSEPPNPEAGVSSPPPNAED